MTPELAGAMRLESVPCPAGGEETDVLRSNGTASGRRAAIREWLTRATGVGLLVLAAATPASAQPVAVPDTWGGDFWSRPRLTGSWGGFRDELGKKGVVFDVDLTLTPQAVLAGGRDTGAEFWGNAEYTLNLDTQKLGLVLLCQ